MDMVVHTVFEPADQSTPRRFVLLVKGGRIQQVATLRIAEQDIHENIFASCRVAAVQEDDRRGGRSHQADECQCAGNETTWRL